MLLIIPNYSRKLPRLQVASLASQWYLHFLLISGGFGAIAICSRLVLGDFFYRLKQLPIAKYSYAKTIPLFLLLNCCARLVPDLVLTGNESRAVKLLPGAHACLLFAKLCRHIKRRPNEGASNYVDWHSLKYLTFVII